MSKLKVVPCSKSSLINTYISTLEKLTLSYKFARSIVEEYENGNGMTWTETLKLVPDLCDKMNEESGMNDLDALMIMDLLMGIY